MPFFLQKTENRKTKHVLSGQWAPVGEGMIKRMKIGR
jgi:hypothetical protein